MHGGNAVELVEIEKCLIAIIEKAWEFIGRTIGFVTERLHAHDQPALEVAVPEQLDVALEPCCRAEGLHHLEDGVWAAKGGQGAVGELLRILIRGAAVELAQPPAIELVELVAIEEDLLLAQAIDHDLEGIAAEQLDQRLGIDAMPSIVELHAGQVDHAMVALEESHRMLHRGAGDLHRHRMSSIQQHRQHGAFEVTAVGEFADSLPGIWSLVFAGFAMVPGATTSYPRRTRSVLASRMNRSWECPNKDLFLEILAMFSTFRVSALSVPGRALPESLGHCPWPSHGAIRDARHLR